VTTLLWFSRGAIPTFALMQWWHLVNARDYSGLVHLAALLLATYFTGWWWSNWRETEIRP
jgi:hypothetical protein